jgi:ribosomal protein L10
MNMKDIRDKARDLNVKVAVGWNKITAIRAIQTAEGYESCFGRGLYLVCGQPDCCFRSDCEKIPGE